MIAIIYRGRLKFRLQRENIRFTSKNMSGKTDETARWKTLNNRTEIATNHVEESPVFTLTLFFLHVVSGNCGYSVTSSRQLIAV